MTTPPPEDKYDQMRRWRVLAQAEELALIVRAYGVKDATEAIARALTEAAHASALAEAAKHADCCVDREALAELVVLHTQHLALCGEAQSKQNRERHDLEDRVARQVAEIERLRTDRIDITQAGMLAEAAARRQTWEAAAQIAEHCHKQGDRKLAGMMIADAIRAAAAKGA
jgi:hypothetical protein